MPRDRAAHAALAEDRPQADLRVRRQHGRPGDAAARRPVSAPARRRGRLRLGRRLRAASTATSRGSPADSACRRLWGGPVGRSSQSLARAGGRRHAEHGARARTRCGARSRTCARSRRRACRSSSGGASPTASSSTRTRQSGALFRRIATAEPGRAGPGVRRLLDALARDAGRDAAAARARELRAAPGDACHDRPAPPARARVDSLHALDAQPATAARPSPPRLRRGAVRPR